MPEMTDEQRAAFIDACVASDFGFDRAESVDLLNALTDAGFTITLDAVRDHTGQSVVWEVESD